MCGRCGRMAETLFGVGHGSMGMCPTCFFLTTEFPIECDGCTMTGAPLTTVTYMAGDYFSKNEETYQLCSICKGRFDDRTFSLYMRERDDILCEGFKNIEDAIRGTFHIEERYFPIGIYSENRDWRIEEHVITIQKPLI